jgi:Domain of unknown function (DUF4082)/Fibronectin type III domain/Bacterial Ig domain
LVVGTSAADQRASRIDALGSVRVIAGRWSLRLLVLACLAFPAAVVLLPTSSAGAEGECASAPNPIVCENALPGTPPSEWQVKGVGDPTIQGYATSMSVNAGQTESYKINTPASSYHIEILRLGYYGGAGARLIAASVKPTAELPQNQPECLKEAATGLIDCGNWGVSASWTVPSNAVSGVYIALLTRNDTGGKSQIPFVVRNDSSHSEIIMQTSDATWQAYNDYGGNSLYTCTVACPPGNPQAYKAAYAVSYNRPFDGSFTTDRGNSYLYYAEYQMMRWLEKNGYNVSYTSEAEVDNSGALLKNHKLFVSSGHDEYWSAGQRANVLAAREAGVNLAFFSGNEMFWKTRWGPSSEGSSTPYRTLIAYKETHFNAPVDPQDPPVWTGSWRDPRFSPPADGGLPENALTGQQFEVNSGTADITVPAQYGKLRLWRSTAVGALEPGQSLTLSPGTGTLGYEWDEDVDNGFRPAGEFDLSSTTVSGVQAFTDYGSILSKNSTATHHLTLYRAPSKALVFGAGTVQWSWGLENINAWGALSTDPSEHPPDPSMEQFTVNLLAEMGTQPATLSSGLVAASQSTDTTAPTSTITSPAAGETFEDSHQVTISGTASDTGGGVVAGVEVSTDGGSTWHPATLTTPTEASVKWSYTWLAHGSPSTKIRSRAVDDSANLETPSGGVTVNVSCPCSIWGANVTPSTPDSGDPQSAELGVKFTSETFGAITGVRFYKATTNSGTHTGSLWSASGQRLATATFTGETESGWQQVNFSSPVYVYPNTTYVASYFDPTGHYAASQYYFYTPPATGGNALNSPPLHAIPTSATSGNGVYTYSGSSAFPTSSYQGSNYWVDPVFVPAPAPGQVTGVSGTAGHGSVTLSWSAPSTGGLPTTYTITPYIGFVPQQTTTVTGTPPEATAKITGLTPGTEYTFTVQASNPNGAGAASEPSSAVVPTALTPPTAPTNVLAGAATRQALVSWSPPSNDGGGSLTGYTVTPYIGGAAQTPVEVSPSSTSTIVTGLTNGATYTFTVTAANAFGTSLPSGSSGEVTPQNTIFDFATPATIDSKDSGSVELGVKFTSEASGTITGVRFYKATTNTGTHVGSLWSATGTLLASATFTSETASGWQQVNFPAPVAINAGTTYVAGYFAPKGHYSNTSSGFASAGVSNPPLQALANASSVNGVYKYAGASAFPTSTYKATNYWVDVDFVPTPAPGQVSNVSATAGPGSATLTWNAPSSGGPVAKYTITPYIGSEAQPASTVTGSPARTTATLQGLTNGTQYTFTVQASNTGGAGPVSSASNPVIPTAPTVPAAPSNVAASAATNQALVSWSVPTNEGGTLITRYTVTPYVGATALTPIEVPESTKSTIVKGLTDGTGYTFKVSATNAVGTGPSSTSSNEAVPTDTIFDFATPTIVDSANASSTEVGVQFSSEAAGMITGIRFYKATTNTGTHIGSLWSSTGTLLAQATFTNETASGWQQVNFSTPVAISPSTTYVAAYLAPNGHYSETPSAFTTAGLSNPPLQALANPIAPDGVYTRTSTSAFPTSTSNATDYWVDVDFVPTPVPGQVTGVNATAGAVSATVKWSAPSSGGPVTTYTITPYIGSEAQPATTINGSPPATEATIKGLTGGTSYTFTVQASNTAGAGPASEPSNSVTPTGPTVPSSPTGVTASAATKQALVIWSAPANEGGSPLTGYTVTPFIGASAQTPVHVGPSVTSTTLTGLANGTSYTFEVAAGNEVGESPLSSASNSVTPQDTIFDFATPATIDSGDGSSVELGVKFSSEFYGMVSGIRFYKATTNTGTHVGSLWSSTGALLAQATFTNETASGWQQVNFSTPVVINPNTTYVAGYLAPKGHYSDTSSAFTSVGVNNPPLQALANTTSLNGVYAYTAISAFPTSSVKATNYWVDVDFMPAPPPGQVTNVNATAGIGSANVTWSAPASDGPVTTYTITPYIGSEAQPATTINGAPPATGATIKGLTIGTSYTFTVQASNPNGAGPSSEPSNAVTPISGIVPPSAPTQVIASSATQQAQLSWTAPSSNGGGAITGYVVTPYVGASAQTPVEFPANKTSAVVKGLTNATSYTFTVAAVNSAGVGAASTASNAVTPQDTIFDFATPATIDSNDGSSVVLGVKFTSEAAGSVTGIRFYKAATNTGTHIGSLWSATGTLLASATFTNETASGWQQVNFSTPVTIAANTTYIASYLAPKGHYSDTSAAFTSVGVSNPPLQALANTASANGVYKYSTTNTFPSSSYKATNYWVDVDFEPSH